MKLVYCIFYLYHLDKDQDEFLARWTAILDTSLPLVSFVIVGEVALAQVLEYSSLMVRAGSLTAAAIGLAISSFCVYLILGTEDSTEKVLAEIGERAGEISKKQHIYYAYMVGSVLLMMLAWALALRVQPS
jgi:hypothetical protein